MSQAMNVRIEYQLTDKGRADHTRETGNFCPTHNSTTFDLRHVDSPEREQLWDFAMAQTDDNYPFGSTVTVVIENALDSEPCGLPEILELLEQQDKSPIAPLYIRAAMAANYHRRKADEEREKVPVVDRNEVKQAVLAIVEQRHDINEMTARDWLNELVRFERSLFAKAHRASREIDDDQMPCE